MPGSLVDAFKLYFLWDCGQKDRFTHEVRWIPQLQDAACSSVTALVLLTARAVNEEPALSNVLRHPLSR